MFEDLPEKQAWEKLLDSFFEVLEEKERTDAIPSCDRRSDLAYCKARDLCKKRFDKYMEFVVERQRPGE